MKDIEFKVDERGHLYAEFSYDHDFIADGAVIRVKIIADSITDGGCRLITWTWLYPRMIHSEVMTHRDRARNAASSRAIPMATLRERVIRQPAMPVDWGRNQKGMQAGAEIDDVIAAKNWWLDARNAACEWHARGEALGLHKQITNRVIEPWMNIETIISSTEHANLFHLRKHKDAEPSFQHVAMLAWELFHNSMPTFVRPNGWHLPYVYNDDIEAAKATEELIKLSVGRCARVSYLTHEGKRDRQADYDLHDRLVRAATTGDDPLHASPLEHQARAVGRVERHGFGEISQPREYRSGPFVGWQQYRKTFANENGPKIETICELCGVWNGGHGVKCPNRPIVHPPRREVA